MTCDKCGKECDNLIELILDDEPSQMLCNDCWGWNDARADYEYERQKEEGWLLS